MKHKETQLVLSLFLESQQPTRHIGSDIDDILRRANLISYNKKFYAQGFHSPHDLLKANKEEFAQYMTLVGMASTPGHVIAFKRCLHEWADEQGIILCLSKYHYYLI